MLTDLGRDVDVMAPRERVKPLDRILRHDDVAALPVMQAFPRAPALDLGPPGLERRLVDLRLLRLPGREQLLEHPAAIADDWQVDLDVLVDRGAIDVDVDFLGARGKGVKPSGDAVVETRADADHHVAI